MFIGHGVERAEDLALLGAIGGLVFPDDEYGSYDEEEEKG